MSEGFDGWEIVDQSQRGFSRAATVGHYPIGHLAKDHGAVIGRVAKAGSVALKSGIVGFIVTIFKISKIRRCSYYASLERKRR